MNKENTIINEIRGIPILSGNSAIAPFLEIRHKDTDLPLPRLYSVNVKTGECIMMEWDEKKQPKLDENNRQIFTKVFLDLKLYYIAFK